MNPLLKNYNAAKAGATVSASPQRAAAPAPTPTGAPAAFAAPVSSAPTNPAGANRDIAALRARLAGGSLGGVNPPEAATALPADALEARTVPTADGGAQAAPGWTEAKNGLVVRAAEASTAVAAVAAPAAKRTRRTKAEMEAARAAAAPQQVQTSVFQAVAQASATSGAELTVEASAAFALSDFSTDDLLAEIYKRVAARFA